MDERPPDCLVFDVGGTSIRAAVYDRAGDKLTDEVRATTTSSRTAPGTPPDRLLEMLVDDLRRIGTRLLDDPAVVSIGFPGPVDPAGVLLAAPTVLGQDRKTVDLCRLLDDAWPAARVLVANDVTVAGYALARGTADSFCVVTVSSGVGCKVFLDGRPVLGANGRGGEIGHLRVDPSPDANICECGGRGHLGAVASGRGVLLTARRLAAAAGDVPLVSCEGLAAAFRAGEPFTSGIVTTAADALGASLAGVHTALGLERFVLTGGFALALGERYRRLVAHAAAASCWDLGQDWDAMVEMDPFGGRAGLLGAGRYARVALGPAVPA
jgi:C7-cyclitol 7-kinase